MALAEEAVRYLATEIHLTNPEIAEWLRVRRRAVFCRVASGIARCRSGT